MATRKSRTLKMRKSKKTRNNRKYSRKLYGGDEPTTTGGPKTTKFEFYLDTAKGGAVPKLIKNDPSIISINPISSGIEFSFLNNPMVIKSIEIYGVKENGETIYAKPGSIKLAVTAPKSNTFVIAPKVSTKGEFAFNPARRLTNIRFNELTSGSLGILKKGGSANLIVKITTDNVSMSNLAKSSLATSTLRTTTMPTTTMPTTTMPTSTVSS